MMIGFELRYTSSTSYTSQSDPNNSIGGYISTNTIYTSDTVRPGRRPSDTTIGTNLTTLVSPSSGLASIGQEVFSYAGTEFVLFSGTNYGWCTGLTRGISPGYGFPGKRVTAGDEIDQIHFLEPDLIFSRGATKELVQHRCVALVATDSGLVGIGTQTLRAKILINQHPDANAQIDVGIEIPRVDAEQGVAGPGGIVTSFTINAFIGLFFDNYFNNLVVWNRTQPTEHSVVQSYDDSTGTFIISPAFNLAPNPGDIMIIFPAESQIATNEVVGPSDNSGRFYGYIGDGGSDTVVLNVHGIEIGYYDVIYLWVKRTLRPKVKSGSNIGATISIIHEDNT